MKIIYIKLSRHTSHKTKNIIIPKSLNNMIKTTKIPHLLSQITISNNMKNNFEAKATSKEIIVNIHAFMS